MDQSRAPVDLASAKSRLRRRAHQDWTSRIRPTRYGAQNGLQRVIKGDRLGLPRQQSMEVARLRAAHLMLLGAYKHRIG